MVKGVPGFIAMKTLPLQRRGFTLIELLVVISIIAILAGIAVPVFSKAQESAARTKVLSNGKQVGLSCKIFAGDYNGEYPFYTDPVQKTGKASNSNDLLATLIPDYLSDEMVFNVPKSAYCRPGPNGNTRSGDVLKGGENGFSYVQGLTDTSNSRYPLLATGFAPGGQTYVNDEGKPGGVWRGEYAIVVRCDISAAAEKTVKRGTSTFVKRDDNANKNAFEPDPGADPPWLSGADVKVLNPLVGTR